MIKRASELDFSSKHFTLIIAGAPGLGKTTLALSAPSPLLFDFDGGISRVKAEHRQLTSTVDTYEDMLADMETEEYREAESIIIDTGGSLVQAMQPWAKKQDAKAARDGRAMFGVVKREFDRLCAQIRRDGKNLIVVFHTTEQPKGDVITQRLSCEGGAKDIVWTPADFGGCMYMLGTKRVIGFTPTEEYFAKGCFGISGLREIPQLKPGEPNDFLAKLFAEARANIAAEAEQYGVQRRAYDAAMQEGREILATVTDAASATAALEQLRSIAHGLTSRAELNALMTARCAELHIRYDKGAKAYVAEDIAEPN